MVFHFFRIPSAHGLEHVEQRLVGMLADCRHGFDTAMSALVGGADPATVGDEVRETDRRVNLAEHEVRRELIVHAAVHGAEDVAGVLAAMLAVKKIERIGDQTKNVFDLAAEGVDFSEAPDRDELIAFRDEVSSMIGEAAAIFGDPEDAAAEAFLVRGDALLKRCNAIVSELLHTTAPGSEAVPRALLYRYGKRIVANLNGVVATLVRPLADVDRYEEGVDLDE